MADNNNADLSQKVYLTPRELMEYLNLSRSTLKKMRDRPDFPRPRMLSERTHRYVREEVDAFVRGEDSLGGRPKVEQRRKSLEARIQGTQTPSE